VWLRRLQEHLRAMMFSKEWITKDRTTEPGLGAERQAEARDAPDSLKRDGIVLSTAVRLSTSDGRTFDDPAKAMEHEAFYQILKRLVKGVGLPDNDETASFALLLARTYPHLLPLLGDLARQADALKQRLREYERTL